MIKTQFQKEIAISATQLPGSAANTKKEVSKIQCWLNLYAQQNPGSGTSTAIDGDYGAATERAVINFQKAKRMPQTGKVDADVFAALCEPMRTAFTTAATGNNLRELIISMATIHLNGHPFELVVKNQSNSGPWVRAYMDGHEGETWFWCMGFVQTIIDGAASLQRKDFRALMPLTYSCDVVAVTGLHKGLLKQSAEVRRNPSLVKPGDIFLIRKAANDWLHTGLILNVQGDVFDTVEGNTNTDGSHNGNGVYRRQRNFMRSVLDVFSIEPLV